jgi:nucleotide-binding universal stress UspA family protein
MSDLDKLRIERESRSGVGSSAAFSRYSEAIDRFLGAACYRDEIPVVVSEPVGPPAIAGVVMVGVDDSAAGCLAVDHAAIEAELRGWGLRIVHVQRGGPLRPAPRDDGTRLLERLAARVHAYAPALAVTSRLLIGSPASLLLSQAADAGLVVVGRRHSATATVLGPGIGDRVASLHPGIVMVVRAPGRPSGTNLSDRPIVVGVELPGTTSPAVHFGLREAGARGCELIIVNAVPHAVPSERLEVVGGLRVRRRLVDQAPAAALIRASEDAAAVVVGRHAYGGSATPLLGSVSRAVLRDAHCPVFVAG